MSKFLGRGERSEQLTVNSEEGNFSPTVNCFPGLFQPDHPQPVVAGVGDPEFLAL